MVKFLLVIPKHGFVFIIDSHLWHHKSWLHVYEIIWLQVYDIIWLQVYDIVWLHIYDTIWLHIYDTIWLHVYDCFTYMTPYYDSLWWSMSTDTHHIRGLDDSGNPERSGSVKRCLIIVFYLSRVQTIKLSAMMIQKTLILINISH